MENEKVESLVGGNAVSSDTQQVVSDVKKPVKTIRSGGVVLSVWQNKNHKGGTFYSATIKKNYKDGDEWKSCNSFNKNDLPDLSFCCQEAFMFMGD